MRITAALFFVLLAIFLILFFGNRYVICQHQQSVIMELKQWEAKYNGVSSMDEAFDSIDMYEYISGYYLAGEGGYYCSKEMSLKLESQRKRLLSIIIKELEGYTGKKYGSDLQKWKQWMKENGG